MSNFDLDESQPVPAASYPFAHDRLLLTCGLAGLLLFWAALDDHSDGFYTFLRVYVCGLSLIWAMVFHSIDRPVWALGALCSAILFNPIFTVDFDRETWQTIDFIAGALYSWLALQTYAAFKRKPWIPYAPAGLLLGLIILAEIDFNRPYGTALDRTMNVDETMTTNEILADMDPAIEANAQSVADDALNAAANAVEDAANAVENANTPDSSGDAVLGRIDRAMENSNSSDSAAERDADQTDLDRIFSSPRYQDPLAPATTEEESNTNESTANE